LRITDQTREPINLAMRLFEKVVDEPQFIYQCEGRGMDGIAAKVAQEIAMFLEHDDVNAGPREKEAEHESTRTAAGDAALGG
jgi:hypothetical protein